MTITEIQTALMARGFDPGVIDGVWGRRTAAAVRAFQGSRGLVVDGVVGPKTREALGLSGKVNDPLADVALVWFQEARRLIGVREGAGKADNPTILDWAGDLGIPYKGDDIAWCGLFTAHCIGSTLSNEPLPNNPLGARNWLKFGAPTVAQPGAVAVFWRGSRNGWQGHVGFYAGEDATAIRVLGGNQKDSVNLAWIQKDRLLGFRWPGTAPEGPGKSVKVTRTEGFSPREN